MVRKSKKWHPHDPAMPVRRSELEFDEMSGALEDVPIVDRKTSFWAVDDSGTADVGYKSSEYLVLTAVTTLQPTDYGKLFQQISLKDGEIKFSLLRMENPDEAVTLMHRVGNTTAVILCYPRYKDPRNARSPGEFFLESLQLLVDGIMRIDRSSLIVITVDDNNYLEPSDYYALSSPRCIVHPTDSKESKLLQMVDSTTSSLGHALLPERKGNTVYFEQIQKRSYNVHGKPGECTQQTPIGFNRDIVTSATEDKNVGAQNRPKGCPKGGNGGETVERKRDSKGRFVKSVSNKAKGSPKRVK